MVDDGSDDGTTEIIKNELLSKLDRVVFHQRNPGKGAAIISAKKFIKGDVIIIQDADLEYDPKDYDRILKAMSRKMK